MKQDNALVNVLRILILLIMFVIIAVQKILLKMKLIALVFVIQV